MHTVAMQQTARETFQCRCPHLRGCNAGTHCSNRPAVCRWKGSVSVVGDEQGVLVVGICDDERAERVLFKQKSFDDKRIKLCPPAFHDDLPGGFVVVLIAVAIVGRLLRKVFHFAGFGIPDHLLGVAVSAAKTLLILGLLFSAFESLNKDHTLAEEKTLDRSVCYRPMIRLADSLFPLLEWAKEQVSIDEQELWSDNSPER